MAEEELPPPEPGTTSLVIVESPAKARTIGKYLGRAYRVKATVGHVRDLPEKKLGIDVDGGFEPEYVTIPGKEKTVADLKAAAKDAREIFLATDPDREGEAIAWHIAEIIAKDATDIRRVTFNEITRGAVLKALENPGTIDLRKVDAQQARKKTQATRVEMSDIELGTIDRHASGLRTIDQGGQRMPSSAERAPNRAASGRIQGR